MDRLDESTLFGAQKAEAPSGLPAHLAFQIELLADEALSQAEEAELLQKLDSVPGGWRRCALALLEVRALRRALKSIGIKEARTEVSGRLVPADSQIPRQSPTWPARIPNSDYHAKDSKTSYESATKVSPVFGRHRNANGVSGTFGWGGRLIRGARILAVFSAVVAAFFAGQWSTSPLWREDPFGVTVVRGRETLGDSDRALSDPSLNRSAPANPTALLAHADIRGMSSKTGVEHSRTGGSCPEELKVLESQDPQSAAKWPEYVPLIVHSMGNEHAVVIPLIGGTEQSDDEGQLVGEDFHGVPAKSAIGTWIPVTQLLGGRGHLSVERRFVEWLTIDGRRVVIPVEDVWLTPADVAAFQ